MTCPEISLVDGDFVGDEAVVPVTGSHCESAVDALDTLREGAPVVRITAHGRTLGTPEFETFCQTFDTRTWGYRIVKRICDILFSLMVVAVALCLLPITILILLIVAIQTKGSPVYVQQRVGRYGRPLRILKVRTMVADSDDVKRHLDVNQLAQWKRERKVDNDPRIVPIGTLLRKTSLDELPQFLNVLVGSMSVVGVRPVVTDELEAYGDDVAEFLSLRPGITGWWQTQARNNATYEDGNRQDLELYYCRNASFALDTRIFVSTFSAMFGKRKTGR